nr:hypothetical protein [uncultured Desulfobacter sp.]
METATLTSIIAILVLSLLPVVITWKVRDNIADSDRNELPKIFLSSPIVLGIVSLNYGISLLWLYLPLSFPNHEVMDWIIFSIIAFVWFVSTILVFNRIKNSKVTITKHELKFQYGKKIKIVKREDIINVNSINGCIIIDTIRKKNEIMIPMIFQGNSKIISFLR